MTLFDFSYVLLWLVVLAACVGVLALLRHVGVLFQALDPFFSFVRSGSVLQQGDVVPSVSLEDLTTRQRAKVPSQSGTGAILLILRPSCSSCEALLSQLRDEWAGLPLSVYSLSLLVIGSASDAATIRRQHDVPVAVPVFFDRGGSKIRDGWGVTTTPFLLILDPDLRLDQKVRAPTGRVIGELLRGVSPSEIGDKTCGGQGDGFPGVVKGTIELKGGERV